MIRAIQEIQYGVAQCRSWKRKDEAWRTYSLDQSHLKRIKTVHVQSVLAIEIDSSDARLYVQISFLNMKIPCFDAILAD